MNFSTSTTATAADWERWACRNVEVRHDGIEIASEPSVAVTPLSFSALDVTVDADGIEYALRPSGTVYRYDERRGIEHRLLASDDHELSDPQAVCVSGDRLYVLGSDGAVAVVSTRLQRPIGTITTDCCEPVTIAAAAGRLYLLDTASGVVTLQPDGSVEPVFDSVASPIDMAVDPTGELYVLDERDDHREVHTQASTGEIIDEQVVVGSHRVIRKRTPDGTVDPGRFPLSTFETAAGETVTPTRLAVSTDTPLLLVGRTAASRWLVTEVDPETPMLRERGTLESTPQVFRSPDAADDSTYAVVGKATALRLDPLARRIRDRGAEGYVGHAYRQFDSGIEAVQWHRLVVDRDASTAGTQLRLSYLASDEPAPLAEPLSSLPGLTDSELSTAGLDTVWDLLALDPAVLAARSETLSVDDARGCLDAAFEAVETATDGQWQTVESPTDMLLSAATGRYLTVRLELVGGPTASPRVDSLRAVWPRQSYLQYLPELYRSSSESAAFLEQYLSVFGTMFTDIEREIESTTRYLDPEAVPAEALPWLATWLGVDRIQWPTPALRKLVASAPELYKRRGTKDGLRDLLLLYLRYLPSPDTPPADRFVPDDRPPIGVDIDLSAVDHGLYILEPSDLDVIDSRAAKATYEAPLSGARSVAVFAGPFAEDDHREAVDEIVRQETPAHVQTSLIELNSVLTLGSETFLGINSRLGERRLELGEAALGETAVLD